MSDLTHLDTQGRVRMVDVSQKDTTDRRAKAAGNVIMDPQTLDKIMDSSISKGNVLETARIAGVMAAKKTSALIPMCHPLELTHVSVDFVPDRDESLIRITAQARVRGRTGVEMEALTAVAVAALTIYDMCKAVDRSMGITGIRLVEKSGGKSGDYLDTASP